MLMSAPPSGRREIYSHTAPQLKVRLWHKADIADLPHDVNF